MSDQTCSDCRFYLATKSVCRFGPPTVFMNVNVPVVDQSNKVVAYSVFTAWPPKSPDDWCGQHETIA